MSDLAATNCGCNTCDNGCNSCNIIWIILLLSCFCGNGSSFSMNGGNCGNDNCCWIIILLLLFCNNGNGNGCGCGSIF
ncbi:MAG: chorion class high-cysteine HCB protein 13 [Lachnospiraceae bacterium]|nr:chorion class high-cysteine HCB protein 13 [Lachnospiraceae bacterium]MDD7333023.1 chorion class high-cysteine HCB protein 13 [Lachnospiraceae bacterium]MDY3274936.1 chorion class high-cysteine HCB protein 13 [Agathobacter sp.]MDY5521747.1 chorion class high-cysteine HCB protein 13 [Agathobacter sp.]